MSEILKEIRVLRERLEHVRQAEEKVEETALALELAHRGEASEEEVHTSYQSALSAIEELELTYALSGEEDRLGAVMEIKPGAGGTESCDWAEMLMRMYMRWGEKHGYTVRIADLQSGEVAGIKSATIIFEGEYAYGYLKGETGTHRLVRISPFDASRRRHTSFAGVFVTPLVDEDIHIEIKPEDLQWETFRASGPGGQHVQKNETAVRVRHLPTGIVVQCQQERSQAQNRRLALQILRSRLYQLELQKRREKLKDIAELKKKIEWGSQIRSYVLYPYKLVKDLRTGVETTQVEAVLDGDIDMFLRAYLLHGQNRSDTKKDE